ncbi:HAD family hydrolase [Shewanella mangrovi]|uniref:HAD family hydrolase n=2 Tax=Shewanella mangrovi TaxID=1515746 RepID=A0A094K1X2_9GAMM|nr:HAD family hydrolase [Shewanella mangrovi]
MVVFDWDGTVMDSIGRILECLRDMCHDLDLDVPHEQACRDIIGLSLSTAVKQLFPRVSATTQEALQLRYRHHFLRRADEPLPLFDGIEQLLGELQQRDIELAVATGKSRAGLDRMLAQTGLGRFFRHTRTADEAQSKPHPDMLQQLLQATGHDANKSMMVGDSLLDLSMANSAGFSAVGVSYGAHGEQKLQCCNPKAVIHQPLELLQWL